MISMFEPSETPVTTRYGGDIRIVVSEEVASNLMSGVIHLKPGESLVPDIHESDEVYYLVSGSVTVRDDKGGQEITAGPGKVVLIPKGLVHVAVNPGPGDTLIFWTFSR